MEISIYKRMRVDDLGVFTRDLSSIVDAKHQQGA